MNETAAEPMVSLKESESRQSDLSSAEEKISHEYPVSLAGKDSLEIEQRFLEERVSTSPSVEASHLGRPWHAPFSPKDTEIYSRLITRNEITEEDKKRLIEERNSLIERKFKNGLTIKEVKRLKYVRWQLDRIDDAENGEMLDYLEKIAQDHKEFAEEIHDLLNQLAQMDAKPKPRQRANRQRR